MPVDKTWCLTSTETVRLIRDGQRVSDTDTSFIVKAADPYTRKELGVVGDEPILHFNTVFDDVMDDVHCTLFCTLHIHEHKIHDMHTECWVTSIKPISHCLTVAHQYRVTKPAFLICVSKRQ